MKTVLARHVCAAVLLALPLLAGQGKSQPRSEAEPDDLPVADWQPLSATSRPTDEATAGQGPRNRWIRPGPPIRATDTWRDIFTHDVPKLLPVADSDAVVTGEVLSAAARLSADHRELYSEFLFQVESVHYSKQGAKVGDVLTLVRTGGAVRLPSGRIFRLRVVGKRMPTAGNRYLLFLRVDPSSSTFYIHSGYHFRGGVAHPLDQHAQLKSYDNMPENELLDRLQEAAALATDTKREK